MHFRGCMPEAGRAHYADTVSGSRANGGAGAILRGSQAEHLFIVEATLRHGTIGGRGP